MKQFVVYHNPSDFPGKYVVREFLIGPGTITPKEEPLCVVDNLSQARNRIPPETSFLIKRHPTDDPVIVEVWL